MSTKSSPPPLEPESLAVLHASFTGMCSETKRARKSIELRYFQKVLKAETRWFEINELVCAHLAEGLAFYWLFLMAQRLGNTKSIDIYTDDINLILKIIIKYNLVDVLVNKYSLANELAFIVGVRVFQTTYGKHHSTQYHAGELLAQWFGHATPERVLTKLDAYVDYMYGAGAWELYATEISWQGKIPRHLYDANLAVNGPESARSRTNSKRVINLPDDL